MAKSDSQPPDPTAPVKPVVIKKYANRRLYNTASSSYVTLDHLCQMVKEGVDFVVYDAKSQDDITRQVLTQIIVEEEAKGQNLLPISFLRQLIGFYGDSLQSLLPNYLDVSMNAFSHNREKMNETMRNAFGGFLPLATLEEMGRQNVSMLERAMRMFTPFGEGGSPGNGPGSPPGQAPSGTSGSPPRGSQAGRNGNESARRDSELDELRAQLAAMQEQLNRLADK